MTTVTTVIPGQRDESEAGLGTWPLVERAKAGDAEAFAELYRLYRPTVHSFVLWRLNGPFRREAEDVTSAVFSRALTSIANIDYRGRDIGAWFVTIARNLVADLYKSGYSRFIALTGPLDLGDIGGDLLMDVAAEDEPHLSAARHELRADLEVALGQITPEQARVIRLRYLDELSIDEAGAAMGLTTGAVKALTYRAIHALRKSDRLAAHR